MSTLREHIERLDRHRAAMPINHAAYGTPTAVSHALVTFVQDGPRSVEWWHDDVLADALLAEHTTALARDTRAAQARVSARRRLWLGWVRLVTYAIDAMWQPKPERKTDHGRAS